MEIGKLKLETPLALAPMAGITDWPFRVLCRRQGSAASISEMVSAKGLLYNNSKTFKMLAIQAEERPAAIQLFGSDPRELAEAARITAASGADFIDFNMGCPVPKIVNNGEGSALMRRPELVYEILARMAEASSVPVTVKIRSGWDSSCVNACEIACLAERAGVAAIAVHARTRAQFYSGTADWTIIKAVKDSVKIPVWGNGDLKTPEDAQRMLAETGCDGLMIGRAADGNPWIFQAIKAVLRGASPRKITLEERLEMIKEHFRLLIECKGEIVAAKEMRRHINAYLKGLPHAAAYRMKFHQINTYQDCLILLTEYCHLLGD